MSFEPVEVPHRKSGRTADWESIYGSTREAKATILERVGRGQPFKTACDQALIPYPTAMKWRKVDESFGSEIRSLMDHNKEVSEGPEGEKDLGPLPPKMVSGTPESFLFYYELSMDRSSACKSSGVRPTEILSWSDESSDKYNEDFAQSMRDLELHSIYGIEDGLLRKAASGVDFKAMQFVLERRLKERYARPGQIGVQVENLGIWFSPQKESKAVKFLNGMRAETETLT